MMREILVKLINTSSMDIAMGSKWEQAIDQALAQIKEELLGKLPKEKTVEQIIKSLGKGYSTNTYAIATKVANDCLSQVKKIIEELFE